MPTSIKVLSNLPTAICTIATMFTVIPIYITTHVWKFANKSKESFLTVISGTRKSHELERAADFYVAQEAVSAAAAAGRRTGASGRQGLLDAQRVHAGKGQ